MLYKKYSFFFRMVSVLLDNIPQHICTGPKFETDVLKCIFNKHQKSMTLVGSCNEILDELPETGDFTESEMETIKHLIATTKKISWLNHYLKIVADDLDFSLPENCHTCQKEMKKIVKWLFKRGEKARKKIRAKINEALVTRLRLYDVTIT